LYRAINSYLNKGRLWLWQCQIFRIFANSANKRQTTVTIDQILTQKWFLLQKIKDSSLDFTFVMMFSITKIEHAALLPVWPSFGKNFQIETSICNQNYFHAFPWSLNPKKIWTYVQNFNLNNCWSHVRTVFTKYFRFDVQSNWDVCIF
jgi:hypothetical protein